MRSVFVLVFLLASVPAQASVIYTYVGNTFTDIVDLPFPPGTFDTSMQVTGSFELQDPLAANLPLTDIGADVLDFSFSDGRSTLTASDLHLSTFFFVQTGAAGQITVWDIIVQQTLSFSEHDTSIVTQNDTVGSLGLFGVQDSGLLSMCDPALVPRGECRVLADMASVDNAPGGWSSSSPGTPTPVPEPASFGLMALGASALFARLRGRSNRA